MTPPRKRALSTEAARQVRQQGHDDAGEFATLIGGHVYENGPQNKKDVIDLSGDTHSVKSGVAKWQVFLYRRNRFTSDEAFRVMDEAEFLVQCIDAFPESFAVYQRDKLAAKERLKTPMRRLCTIWQDRDKLKAFLAKAFFDGREVTYLTIKQDGNFLVFLRDDVLQVLSENFEVVNSQARAAGQVSDQKVLLRYLGRNVGELEMRNESEGHYREIRFNAKKPQFLRLLLDHIAPTGKLGNKVIIHGKALRKFGRWSRSTETPAP